MRRRLPNAQRFSRSVALWTCAIATTLAVGAWGWTTPGAEASAAVSGSGTSSIGGTAKPVHGVHSAHQSRHYAKAFRISGNVQGLYPGADSPLDLVIANKLSKPILVTSIDTTVSSASRSCPASDVTVTSFVGRLPVAGHRKSTLRVEVAMAHSAPNGCQGVRFTFTYVGQGRTT
jgi:hypothetical protein